MEGRSSISGPCWRSLSSRPRMLAALSFLLLLLAGRSLQDEYTFIEEPEPYYYIVEGTAGVIPCAADVALDDGTSRPISVTLVLNSVPLDIHAIQSDTRIFAHLTNNVVVGLLLVNAMASDSQTVLECVVMDGNTTVLSASTTFLIGDGRPLTPLSHPVQTAETIHSITLGWGESLTPSHAPITHYTILLVELLEIEREIIFESFSNDTDAEVTGLSPGVMYRIYVYGVNDIGEGQRSNYVVGRTASSLVPLPPTRLNAEVVERGRVFDVILSWMPTPVEPDMMSPITHFVIYYGRDETALMNYTTTHTEPTRYNMSGWTEKGEWLVGVASANNAGIGQASYTEIDTGTSTGTTTTPFNLTTIVGIAGGCAVFLVVILIIIITICIVRYRVKILTREEQTYIPPPPIDELDGSPSSKHTGRVSDSSYSSTELQTLDSEPKRAGSRTPPPTNDCGSHCV
ncbi:uncharacterized protein LOC135351772 isoform X2 [Halichondria panicea]|uniref:uncharacterized protein LOC135351772 isoform X2 n=1 Tax=Halichondria panicea TaxID=6063 RepID=UPI00312B7DD3